LFKKREISIFPGYHHFPVFLTLTPYDYVPALVKRAVADK
jgi:hypothetical protein